MHVIRADHELMLAQQPLDARRRETGLLGVVSSLDGSLPHGKDDGPAPSQGEEKPAAPDGDDESEPASPKGAQ
jgi:hypothetical protein